MQYILDKADQPSADKLAIVCGLDINHLYQVAANLKLDKGDVQQAARFFQQSKVCSTHFRILHALHWCLQDTYVVYAAVLTEWENDWDSANHVKS